MRILIVTPKLSMQEGGGEVSVGLLARTLVAAGHEARVLTEAAELPTPEVTVAPITPGAVAQLSRNVDVVHAYNSNALQATLRGARRAGKPAVVTANSYWTSCLWADRCFPEGALCPGCSIPGLRHCFSQRDPATVGRRVPAPVARLEVWRRTRVLAAYDRIVTLSAASRSVLASDGLPLEKLRVIPNMIDPDSLPRPTPAPPSARSPLVLFAGALKHPKGAHVLVEAFPQLLAQVPQARLVLVGQGPEQARLEALAQRFKVADRITFAGRLPYEELQRLYTTARAFAFPVVWQEPFGRVILEAWAGGAPVVTTTRGGPGEYVEDGVTGCLVPPGDARALANSLARLLTDAPLARRLAQAGRRRLDDFLPKQILPKILNVYEEAIAR